MQGKLESLPPPANFGDRTPAMKSSASIKLKGPVSFATAFGLAMEVNRVADETKASPFDTFVAMRKRGAIECDDKTAAAMAALLRR